MKRIKPSNPTGANGVNWPRHEVKTIEARKRDFIIRIADWTRTKEEPSYDVEVYIGGVYDWNESKTFVIGNTNKQSARRLAIEFANQQTAKLL